MRIIAWNCNMAFRKKAKYVLKEKPDIIVVSESEHPDKFNFKSGQRLPNDVFWYGDNIHKGLGVYSYGNFKIIPLKEHQTEFKYVVPLLLKDNQKEIVLLAVWCQKPKNGANYGAQLWNAIQYYSKLLENERLLIVGDFNSNTIWDRPGREANHSNIVKKLKQYGIESTYHYLRNEAQGKERQATFYLYRNKKKPYHLDYCFASSFFMGQLKKVQVGSHKKWAAQSDHSPLIVDFAEEP
ncbi:exonuclease/endonuclease/phosphatase family protein [Spongiimicrobium salis]|uniref:endonuclease/exonuclease/phosphatase family protein n=1 Tax=Spongiimicrobium salis TaxID=1667022 RepID=UPI00374C93A4